MLADATNTYLYGNERLAQYQAAMQYFGADGLGTVRQIFDASAQVVGNSRYDPYGNVLAQSGATSAFAFAGEQYDAATGLEYLRARYYSSAQGRFSQPDNVVAGAYDPQSINRYSYGYNNPVKNTDPTGHDVIFVGGANSNSGSDPYDDPGWWEEWIVEYTGWTHDQYVDKFYDPWMKAGSDADRMDIARKTGVGVFKWGAVLGGAQTGNVNEAAVKLQEQINAWGLKDVTIVTHSKGGKVAEALLGIYESGFYGKGEVRDMVLIDPPQGNAAICYGGNPSPDARRAGVSVVSISAFASCFLDPCHSNVRNDLEVPPAAWDHSLQSSLAAQVYTLLGIAGRSHARSVLPGW